MSTKKPKEDTMGPPSEMNFRLLGLLMMGWSALVVLVVVLVIAS